MKIIQPFRVVYNYVAKTSTNAEETLVRKFSDRQIDEIWIIIALQQSVPIQPHRGLARYLLFYSKSLRLPLCLYLIFPSSIIPNSLSLSRPHSLRLAIFQLLSPEINHPALPSRDLS